MCQSGYVKNVSLGVCLLYYIFGHASELSITTQWKSDNSLNLWKLIWKSNFQLLETYIKGIFTQQKYLRRFNLNLRILLTIFIEWEKIYKYNARTACKAIYSKWLKIDFSKCWSKSKWANRNAKWKYFLNPKFLLWTSGSVFGTKVI